METENVSVGRCGASLRNKPGKFCRRRPVKGRERCRLHGGAALSGPAHPGWRHGEYSRVRGFFADSLQGRLGEHYSRARNHSDRTDLSDHLALVDARVFELLETISTFESPSAWRRQKQIATEQQALFVALHEARRAPAMLSKIPALLGRIEALVNESFSLVSQGADVAGVWSEISDQINLRRRLVGTAVRQQAASREYMSVEQLKATMSLLSALTIAEFDKIPDKELALRLKKSFVDEIRKRRMSGNQPQEVSQ